VFAVGIVCAWVVGITIEIVKVRRNRDAKMFKIFVFFTFSPPFCVFLSSAFLVFKTLRSEMVHVKHE